MRKLNDCGLGVVVVAEQGNRGRGRAMGAHLVLVIDGPTIEPADESLELLLLAYQVLESAGTGVVIAANAVAVTIADAAAECIDTDVASLTVTGRVVGSLLLLSLLPWLLLPNFLVNKGC